MSPFFSKLMTIPLLIELVFCAYRRADTSRNNDTSGNDSKCIVGQTSRTIQQSETNRPHGEYGVLLRRQYIGPLPQTFHFEDFPTFDDSPFNAARTGLVDAFRLSATAVDAVRQESLSSSYYRYFQEKDRDNVLSAMQSILDRSTLYPELCNSAQSSGNKDIVLWWDDPITADRLCHDGGSEGVGVTAYFMLDQETEGKNSAWNIVMCPSMLAITARRLDEISCNTIDTHASSAQMETAGRILLHEMMHAPDIAIAAGVNRKQIQDYQIFIGDDDNLQELHDGDIVPAYGPFWSRYVNVEQGFGT